jgi:hypothetical protein
MLSAICWQMVATLCVPNSGIKGQLSTFWRCQRTLPYCITIALQTEGTEEDNGKAEV